MLTCVVFMFIKQITASSRVKLIKSILFTLKILSATSNPAFCATLFGWTSHINNPCLFPPANLIPMLVVSVKNETYLVPVTLEKKHRHNMLIFEKKNDVFTLYVVGLLADRKHVDCNSLRDLFVSKLIDFVHEQEAMVLHRNYEFRFQWLKKAKHWRIYELFCWFCHIRWLDCCLGTTKRTSFSFVLSINFCASCNVNRSTGVSFIFSKK